MAKIPTRERDQRRIAPTPMYMPEAWIVGTLLNSYINGDASAQAPGYMHSTEGFVELRGRVKNGGTNLSAMLLPVGYRPLRDQYFQQQGVKVKADGNIVPIRGVYAEYTNATAQALTNGAHTRINFGTNVADTHSTVVTGASWAFTAPVAGWYQIMSRVSVNSTAVQHTILTSLFKGGVETRQGQRYIKAAVAGLYGATMAVQIQLAASDVLYVSCYVDAAGQVLEAAAIGNCFTVAQMDVPVLNEFTLDGIRFDTRA